MRASSLTAFAVKNNISQYCILSEMILHKPHCSQEVSLQKPTDEWNGQQYHSRSNRGRSKPILVSLLTVAGCLTLA